MRHFFFDGNGNVGQVVNESGVIVARYEYDPFGNSLVEDGAYAQENPFRFSTKYFDEETGLYYYGFRYYSPELGRWWSRDPAEEEIGGINLHLFGKNNSINIVDYLGFEPVGHHKIPQELWRNAGVSSDVASIFDGERLSHENYNYHGGKELGGVTHRQYNNLVEDELKSFMKEKNICCLDKMTKGQAAEFVTHINSLPGTHPISKFNAGVIEEIEHAKLFGKKDWSKAMGKGKKAQLLKANIAKAFLNIGKSTIGAIHYIVAAGGVLIAAKEAKAVGWSTPAVAVYVAIDVISPVGAVFDPSDVNNIIDNTKETSKFLLRYRYRFCLPFVLHYPQGY